MKLKQYLENRIRLLLVGPPGCAKTGRMLQAAKECNYTTVILRCSLLERVDVGGCFVPDVAAGVTRLLPLETLHKLKISKDKILLILDDLGQAPIDVQAGLMQLFDQDYFGDNVVIWAATNRPQDKAGVSALCEPLRSRFHLAFSIATPGEESKSDGSVQLAPWSLPTTDVDFDTCEVAQWVNWAQNAGLAPEFSAWHLSTNGRTLYNAKPCSDPAMKFADYRGWETVGNLWNLGIRDRDSISAAIGKGVAIEFLNFAKFASQIPTRQDVVSSPESCPVPDNTSALWLLVSNLVNGCSATEAGSLCIYMDKLPKMFSALMGRDLYRKLGSKLSQCPAWQRWFIANEYLFTVK